MSGQFQPPPPNYPSKGGKSQISPYQQRAALHASWVALGWRVLLGGVGFFTVWIVGLLLFGNLPSFEELENPAISDATEVLSSDGVVLGRYFRENRVRVRYENLSPHLVNALIATEDERFYKHAGIDAEALMRVGIKTVLLRQKNAGGGSTITQQLAKLLFKRPDIGSMNRLVRAWVMVNIKIKEWITAIRLERRYTKEEILTMYLNQFDFLYNAYGIRSASETYFGTSPDSLKVEEAAMLIGMLKNPALYNPKRFPENARNRRTTVFQQMQKNGVLSSRQVDSLKQIPIDLSRFRRVDHNDGLAPYFREYLRLEVTKLLENEVKKPDGSRYDIYTDGLKIYTTIDSRMQAEAERAATEHLAGLQKLFFSHWKGKDPWNYGITKDSPRYELRQDAFRRMMQETDRYALHKDRWLRRTTELELRDVDVERMLRIEKDGWEVADKWLASGHINGKLFRLYKKIINTTDDWTLIKKEWTTLQREVEIDFNRPTKMRVFAYNPTGETDTIMSPYDSLRYHRMILQVGMVSIEPQSGHIKAWVGGANHRYFKFDHVNPTVARQVGSTFKPFLYALSIAKGYSPCYKVYDGPIVIERGEAQFGLSQDWRPKNADGGYEGRWMTLQEGLRKSKNTVSAYLMKDLGSAEPLRSFVEKLGINIDRIPKSPSIALGAADLSVYEMTGAYSVFANQGIYTKPIFITRIEDRNGNEIWRPESEQRPVLEPQVYNAMVSMLKGVMVGASGFNGVKSKIGGKTGTTNEHADGWFMGVTPNLVTGTWVGGDDRWIRFRSLTYGQGAKMARPIFAKYIRYLEQNAPLGFDASADFVFLESENNLEMDCDKYGGGTPLVDFDEYGGAAGEDTGGSESSFEF